MPIEAFLCPAGDLLPPNALREARDAVTREQRGRFLAIYARQAAGARRELGFRIPPLGDRSNLAFGTQKRRGLCGSEFRGADLLFEASRSLTGL